jgi:hypothetical protein
MKDRNVKQVLLGEGASEKGGVKGEGILLMKLEH